jgi:uncharacterized protein (TIGR04255 family)
VLTVNHNEEYTWDAFRPRLLTAVDALYQTYPTDIAPLQPVQVLLRYINAIPLTDQRLSVTEFLARFLHTRVDVDGMLFREGHVANEPTEFNLTLAFPARVLRATATLSFALGVRKGEQSLIWQLFVRSDKDNAPQEPDQFEPWLRAAHDDIIEPWFFTLCRGELLERFQVDADDNS